MTYFHTCVGCARQHDPCETRASIRECIKGLAIGSLKHRCPVRIAKYGAGEPVFVLTVDSYKGDVDEDGPVRDWFPAHFIRQHGTRGVAYIAPGASSEKSWAAFEGTGFVKVPMSRIKPRDGERLDVTECRQCGAMPGVGQACQLDPHYSDIMKCISPVEGAAVKAAAHTNPTSNEADHV